MKTLILGGRGNLGSQLVKQFPGALALDGDDFDILDFSLLSQKIRDFSPKLIINAIAYNAVDRCENDEKELALAYRLNRDLVSVLATLAASLETVLVHYSSDYVFSGSLDSPEFNESSSTNPINNYGVTKAAGEQELLAAGRNQGLRYFLIRTSKLFGPPGTSPFSKPSFFDIMLKLADNKKEISVVDEEVSAFTYTLDLALETKSILDNNRPVGIYHITNDGSATWYQAALELFRLREMKVKLKPISGAELKRPALRPQYSVLKDTKLPPRRFWRQALEQYLETI